MIVVYLSLTVLHEERFVVYQAQVVLCLCAKVFLHFLVSTSNIASLYDIRTAWRLKDLLDNHRLLYLCGYDR